MVSQGSPAKITYFEPDKSTSHPSLPFIYCPVFNIILSIFLLFFQKVHFLHLFPPKSLIYLSSFPMRSTFSANLILLHFITIIIFGEEYKSCVFGYAKFFTVLLLSPFPYFPVHHAWILWSHSMMIFVVDIACLNNVAEFYPISYWVLACLRR
jgi:hypothetical protein